MEYPEHGKNDGLIRGVRYFECDSDERGLMVPLSDVTFIK
jgi:dynactin complex subunit